VRTLSLSAILMCLTLIGCGSSRVASASGTLKSMSVHQSDVPRGFVRDTGRYWNNHQAAVRDNVAVSLYQAHGRQRSYEDAYTQSFALNEPPSGGLHRASSEVTEFRDASDAHWGWLREVHVWRHATQTGATTLGTGAGQAAIPIPFARIPVPRIGAEDEGFSATWGGDEVAYRGNVLVIRQGRYVATVETIGWVGQVHLSLAIALARRIDRRIAASK
jgi:hypothetical protein